MRRLPIEATSRSISGFNLRREAAPHATCHPRPSQCLERDVSISDEKPLHMRLSLAAREQYWFKSFNLRREAAPHATYRSTAYSAPSSFVSISDEKPLHMRHRKFDRLLDALEVSISDEKPLHMRQYCTALNGLQRSWFQSQTRSRSTCDLAATLVPAVDSTPFQSQTRSRSTCDHDWRELLDALPRVSISDEKPLHMRPPGG